MQKSYTDQMHRTIEVPFPPNRIISLVPSQTELLYDLGLNDEVAGQTLFCIHPADKHASKPRVGGTKKLHFEKIHTLHPDLIIGNKEENEKTQIEELATQYPVWMSDIRTLEDALDMIEKVGELVNRKEVALELSRKIQSAFNNIILKENQTINTAYFIWRDPYMAAGRDTFIDNMLSRCGFVNFFSGENSRYPEISDTKLSEAPLDLILLSSEPYPFKQKHVEELQYLCPHAQIKLVDGELFSWYGSRLLKSADYFQKLSEEVHQDINKSER